MDDPVCDACYREPTGRCPGCDDSGAPWLIYCSACNDVHERPRCNAVFCVACGEPHTPPECPPAPPENAEVNQ